MEEPNSWDIVNIGEVKVSYVFKGSVKERPTVSGSYDVYKLAMAALDQGIIGMQEQFLVIYLNRSHKVIGTKVHFIGGLASVVVDIKIIAATAINLLASAVIVCHTHPSGNLEPSDHDKRMTVRLKEALALLDVQLLDHMILSPEGEWLSFVERELI
jgi:DNA repair protein RadC